MKICRSCRDTANEEKAADTNRILRERLAAKPAESDDTRRQKVVAAVGGEKAYRNFRFDTWDHSFHDPDVDEKIYGTFRSFDPREQNLYVWGAPGLGKTHLATAVVRDYADQGEPAQVTRVSWIVRHLLSSGDRRDEVWRKYTRAKVLAIDDFGLGVKNDFAFEVVQELLEERDSAGMNGLIFTSNGDLNKASFWYGTKIADRIFEMCRIVQIGNANTRSGRFITRKLRQKGLPSDPPVK